MTVIAEERQVSTLELFFDLVFVFAITQLTSVLADDPTPVGAVWLRDPSGYRLSLYS